MKVMITGAAGFIGSQLAYALWKQGAELILVDNFSYGKKDNLIFEEHDFTEEVIHMDIRNRGGRSGNTACAWGCRLYLSYCWDSAAA